jgi:hypothetical protein
MTTPRRQIFQTMQGVGNVRIQITSNDHVMIWAQTVQSEWDFFQCDIEDKDEITTPQKNTATMTGLQRVYVLADTISSEITSQSNMRIFSPEDGIVFIHGAD